MNVTPATRYVELRHELLSKRERSLNGTLPDHVEAFYAERLHELWFLMTPAERTEVEALFAPRGDNK